MSLKVGELHATLGLKDRDFNQGVDKAGRKFDGFSSGLKKAAGGAAIAGGAALAGMAAQGLREFASLEKGMNEVFTLMPDISGDAMGDMTDQVRDFSKEFGTLPDEVVPSLYQAISAGVPKDNVFDFLETAQQAAIGGVTDLETAVDGISSVVNAYGDDVIDATRASDLMFTAVRLGKTDFDQLSRSLFNVIPTASSLGVEFGDITAAMAAMTAQGTPTNVATTQMRQMLVELSKEGQQAATTFEELAGQSFQEFIAQGGNVAEALQIMGDAAASRGGNIADLFGSVEAGMAATALTSESGSKAFTDAIGEMEDAAGASEDAFDRMEDSASRDFDKLKASANDLMLEFGEELLPTAIELMETAEDLAPVFSAVVGELMKLTNQAQPLIDALTFVNDLIGDTGDEAGEAEESTSLLGTAFQSLVDFANPLGAIYREVKEAIDDGDDAAREGAEGFSTLGGEMSQIPDAAQESGDAINDLDGDTRALFGAAGMAADASGDLADEQENLGDEVQTTTNRMREQFDLMRSQVDPMFALSEAAREAAEAEDAVRIAREKHGEGSAEHLEALRDQSRANYDLRDAELAVEEAAGLTREAFIKQEQEMGATREEAELLADDFENLDGFEFQPKTMTINTVVTGDAGARTVGSFFGAADVEGRQHGGPVRRGEAYEIGEGDKPELFKGADGGLFMLPGNRGRVLPFGDLNRMVASAEMMAQGAMRTSSEPTRATETRHTEHNYNIPVHAATPEQGAQYVGAIASVTRWMETR